MQGDQAKSDATKPGQVASGTPFDSLVKGGDALEMLMQIHGAIHELRADQRHLDKSIEKQDIRFEKAVSDLALRTEKASEKVEGRLKEKLAEHFGRLEKIDGKIEKISQKIYIAVGIVAIVAVILPFVVKALFHL